MDQGQVLGVNAQGPSVSWRQDSLGLAKPGKSGLCGSRGPGAGTAAQCQGPAGLCGHRAQDPRAGGLPPALWGPCTNLWVTPCSMFFSTSWPRPFQETWKEIGFSGTAACDLKGINSTRYKLKTQFFSLEAGSQFSREPIIF